MNNISVSHESYFDDYFDVFYSCIFLYVYIYILSSVNLKHLIYIWFICSTVIVRDKDDYLKETENQLGDQEVNEEIFVDVVGPLVKIGMHLLSKFKLKGDVSGKILDHFLVKKSRIRRFYFLPKIHKRLYNMPDREVISNCG